MANPLTLSQKKRGFHIQSEPEKDLTAGMIADYEAKIVTAPNESRKMELEFALVRTKLMSIESSYQSAKNAYEALKARSITETASFKKEIDELRQKHLALETKQKEQALLFQKDKERIQAQKQKEVNEKLHLGKLLSQVDTQLVNASKELRAVQTEKANLEKKFGDLKADFEKVVDASQLQTTSLKAMELSLKTEKEKADASHKKMESLKEQNKALLRELGQEQKNGSELKRKYEVLEEKTSCVESQNAQAAAKRQKLIQDAQERLQAAKLALEDLES